MQTSTLSALHPSRRKPIAACVAAIFALVAPEIATCTAVTNCNDTGSNSLRAAIGNTASGGVVDMTGLMCSTITLEDTQIVIPQQDLTIKGPRTQIGVTIAHDGNYDRVFNHQGTGTLSLQYVHVTGGDPYSATHDVNGGCIYSKGNVVLTASSVAYCIASSTNHYAKGGGVFTIGDLRLVSSTIARTSAGDQYSFGAEGGGAHVGGSLTSIGSTISDNSATAMSGSSHGGVGVYHSFDIVDSTISGNSAKFVGGLGAPSNAPGLTGTVDNSTISENHASLVVGGVFSALPTTVRNSTIAFNIAGNGDSNGNFHAPGLDIYSSSNVSLTLESSILSNNTYSNLSTIIDSDLSATSINGTVTVTGNHNLVLASSVPFAPGIVTVTGCPLLGPLRDNGGSTHTHALLSHSAAIDQGTNPLPEQFDQRGPPYKRADGLFANFTDIGAYEVQQEDIVFNTSFESCPALQQRGQ